MKRVVLSIIVGLSYALKGDNSIEELLWAELETATTDVIDAEVVDAMFGQDGTLSRAYGDDICVSAINSWTKDLFSEPYKTMMQYSFRDINDVGEYDKCNELEGASYYNLHLNLT